MIYVCRQTPYAPITLFDALDFISWAPIPERYAQPPGAEDKLSPELIRDIRRIIGRSNAVIASDHPLLPGQPPIIQAAVNEFREHEPHNPYKIIIDLRLPEGDTLIDCKGRDPVSELISGHFTYEGSSAHYIFTLDDMGRIYMEVNVIPRSRSENL